MEHFHLQVVNHFYIYGHLGELSNANDNKYEGCWREQLRERFQNVIDVIFLLCWFVIMSSSSNYNANYRL